MKRYRVSQAAEKDLDEIFKDWAERASIDTADRLIDAIAERFWLLGEYPESGRACEDIGPGIRCFPAGQYLIYYRKAPRGKHRQCFHGSRDQRKSWKQSKK